MSAFTDKRRLAQIIECGLDTPDGSDLRLLVEALLAMQADLVAVTRLAEERGEAHIAERDKNDRMVERLADAENGLAVQRMWVGHYSTALAAEQAKVQRVEALIETWHHGFVGAATAVRAALAEQPEQPKETPAAAFWRRERERHYEAAEQPRRDTTFVCEHGRERDRGSEECKRGSCCDSFSDGGDCHCEVPS